MPQNRSSAVMEQRAHRAPDALDYFPTPPWATRALTGFLDGLGYDLGSMDCWEPACGEMHMARPLGEAFSLVHATDVFSYGQHQLCDFLLEGRTHDRMDWVVTNPPFRLSLDFVDVALDRARHGVAMLTRSAWLEGAERHRRLFSVRPPSYVVTFAERVVMLEGRLVRSGDPDPWNIDPRTGKPRKATTATSYSWSVWTRCPVGGDWADDSRHRWVPPCRLQLERPGDYPDHSARLAAIEAATQDGLGL